MRSMYTCPKPVLGDDLSDVRRCTRLVIVPRASRLKGGETWRGAISTSRPMGSGSNRWPESEIEQWESRIMMKRESRTIKVDALMRKKLVGLRLVPI